MEDPLGPSYERPSLEKCPSCGAKRAARGHPKKGRWSCLECWATGFYNVATRRGEKDGPLWSTKP